MSQVTDTWYVLVDGTHADPADVSTGEDGIMRHSNGVPVALRDSGVPLTSGVATRSNKKAAADKSKRDVKAADDAKVGYQTRST